METIGLAALQPSVCKSEGEQYQFRRLRGQRKAVHANRLQARRKYSNLMVVLSMAMMATLVPRPRIQWTLERYLEVSNSLYRQIW